MAFGSPTGPPAGAREVAQLLELVEQAGHIDFKDARGPLGLTQRQANGKFTRDEAEALIGLLEDEQEAQRLAASGEDAAPAPDLDATDAAPAKPAQPAEPRRISRDERRAAEAALKLREVSSEALAAELQRRGWVVMAP